MRATLDGLEFIGDPTPTELASGDALYLIDPDGLKGWFDGVEMRHETTPRPNAPGDFDAPAFLGPRLISIRGSLVASSAVDFENAMAALDELLADGSMAEFAVVQATGTYTAQVRRHGAVEFKDARYGVMTRFRFELWAPDPTKVLVP